VSDIAPTGGTLTWSDGDVSVRAIPLAPVNDHALEGEEHFRIRLSEPTGGAGLGAPEIEVTIEDDDALRALQFAEPVLLITKPEPFDFTITPPASVRGPLLVRYAIGPALDPNDGAVKRTSNSSSEHVRELRWSAGDTSSRTLKPGTRSGNETYYIALADVAGTLDEGADWKVARITVALRAPTSTSVPSVETGSGGSGSDGGSSNSGGGGSVSLELLSLLTLALLLRFGRAVSKQALQDRNGRARSCRPLRHLALPA